MLQRAGFEQAKRSIRWGDIGTLGDSSNQHPSCQSEFAMIQDLCSFSHVKNAINVDIQPHNLRQLAQK
jgi:hypothetical protein